MSRRPYKREVSKGGWWLTQPRYIRYMAREFSCVLIGAYVLVLVTGLWRLSEGQAQYEAWLARVESPAGRLFAVVAMLFALYHTYTWFQVTPKAMPLAVNGKKVPGAVIVLGHWAGLAVASVLVWLLVVN
ncbi:MAG: fumarate reductase subunit C [Gammaproteobacteria bacterium]|nr:fumarate reductase subunit C [Gammaproteobacteria bacterium]